MEPNVNDYTREMRCEYKGRVYKVRDNGAIFRERKKEGKNRRSKFDEIWTFGRFNPQTGFYNLGQEGVHRIVCTAFHGNPLSSQMVVDHIDTNRCNNRPDNLRWLTRLENILNNPITVAKIETICGLESFLANPSLLKDYESRDPNFKWMHRVTPEEAKASYNNWLKWANMPIAKRKEKNVRLDPGEWIYSSKDEDSQDPLLKEAPSNSLTPGAKQLNWKTPTEFLMCPIVSGPLTIQTYLSNIERGNPFTRTKYGEGGVVQDYGFNEKEDAIYVLTFGRSSVKPWALCKITLQNGIFIHENCGSFFQESGGLKNFTIAMGKEWTKGPVFDDFV